MSKVFKSLEFNEILTQIQNLCSFSLGKEEVKNLKPSNNSLIVKRSLKLSDEVMKMFNLAQEYDLGGVRDVSDLLEKVDRDIIITGLDLLYIKRLNPAVKSIISKVKNTEVKTEALNDLIDTLMILDDLSKDIDAAISAYGEVVDSASSKLKSLRKEAASLNTSFDKTVSGFINANSSILADSISSERNGRVTVLLNSTYKNTMKGVVHGESKSGQSVYFEPEAFISLNNRKQSVQHLITDEINKILFKLSQKVKAESDHIRNNLNTLAKLDSILAIAKWGYKRQAIVSKISEDHSIYLRNSGHPLISKDEIVKNTYKIKDGSMLIVSGPNTGGKTVTLKTIGLSILMTLCGIPVIADEASLPIVDNIFIDLGDQQSVVSSLSTFSSHLTQLSHIVNNVSENSLVLLDELGGGTDPKEGEALAIAVLDYLKSKKAITLVTTHLSGLKKYAQKDKDTVLASVEFDSESLTPTYRFIEGLAGQSNALEIANKFNFPKEIMQQAHILKNQILSDEEKLMAKLEVKEKKLIDKEKEIKETLSNLSDKEEKLQAQLKRQERLETKALKTAEKKAESYIQDKMQKIDKLYEEIQEVHKYSRLHEAIDIKKRAEDQLEVSNKTKKVKHNFKVGDSVRVEGFHHIGKIIQKDRNKVDVDVNGMNVKTKVSKLTPVKVEKKVEKRSKYRVKKTSTAKKEINLIGDSVYEALPKIDKFIDNAILNNLSTVRIVHGMGTGKLRNAVHKNLRKQKSVKSFEYATQAQGGSGATIVKLK